MFRDQILNRFSRPGEKQQKVATHIREKVYTSKILNEETRRLETVIIGRGRESIKELNTTEQGVKAWHAAHPEGPVVIPAGNETANLRVLRRQQKEEQSDKD
jgi:hypothetical protein